MSVKNRELNIFSVAAMLVSVHYGMGFLLGTGEEAFTLGLAGSLYAVSTGLGILAIMVLTKFYWNEYEPIWTLLGNRYGNQVKIIVGVMSWAWMIGIVASQILGGAFILTIWGTPASPGMVILVVLIMFISLLPIRKSSKLFQGAFLLSFLALFSFLWIEMETTPVLLGMVLLALLIMIMSLLPVNKASGIFKVLLILSSLALFYSLGAVQGVLSYLRSPFDFIPALGQVNVAQLIGIPVITILLTVIGMDFQQFIVQAKNVKTAYQGCLLATIILLLLAFMPSAMVEAAKVQGILPEGIDGKETIPFILAWAGGGVEHPVGIILVLSLLVTALGAGGNVLRVMNKTLLDSMKLPESNRNQMIIAAANAILVLCIALTGESIIDLIVSFYAIYVAGVLVPFLAYLIDKRKIYRFSSESIWWSLILGGGTSAIFLIAAIFIPEIVFIGHTGLNILLIGIGFSVVGLLMRNVVIKPS
ncbi:hypothetical protein [Candidatus Parabeggiatoa sp. HSG14]|uniref:hypothetical protein n=1 Tax=Candidatus Parabeggiatoa sp. HSG14 TaxID=3055593 RepID=UPI0025A6B59A|nr:hypothetical protein [Thiotrichales bacterium HSG14]